MKKMNKIEGAALLKGTTQFYGCGNNCDCDCSICELATTSRPEIKVEKVCERRRVTELICRADWGSFVFVVPKEQEEEVVTLDWQDGMPCQLNPPYTEETLGIIPDPADLISVHHLLCHTHFGNDGTLYIRPCHADEADTVFVVVEQEHLDKISMPEAGELWSEVISTQCHRPDGEDDGSGSSSFALWAFQYSPESEKNAVWWRQTVEEFHAEKTAVLAAAAD